MRFCNAPNCQRSVFGTCKISKLGYCASHQYMREDFDRRSIMQKAIDKNKNNNRQAALKTKIRTLPHISENEKQKIDELNKWFDMVATFIKANPYCENCGEFIPEKYYRHASAHIFSKSLFPSVSTHPFNFLILGAGCGCHASFDHSIEKASKMPVWKKACKKFLLFENEIKETHKYLDLFKSHLKK